MTPPRDEGVPSPTPRLSARRRALAEGVTSALIVYVVAGVRAMCDAIMNRSMLGEGPSAVEAWSDDRTVVAVVVASP
jgi:hypothetical protein